MADQDKVLPIAGDSTASSTIPDLKGKGKAPDAPQDVSMDEAEDTSEEEDTEEEVTLSCTYYSTIYSS